MKFPCLLSCLCGFLLFKLLRKLHGLMVEVHNQEFCSEPYLIYYLTPPGMQRLNHLFECCTVLCTMPFIVIEHIKFLPKSFECYVVMNYTHITLIGISDLCGYLIDLSQVTKVGVGLLSSLLDLSSSGHKHVCLTNLGFHGVDQP